MSKGGTSGSRSNLAKKTSGKGIRDSADTEKIVEEKKISYLAWKIFSKEVLKALSNLSVDGQISKIASVLGLQQFQQDTREAIQVELFLTAYSFSTEEGFSPVLTSAFLTLLHTLLVHCKDGKLSLVDSVAELKQLMDGAGSTDRCPMGSMSREQAEKILEYVMTSFFQHYRLYEYVFSEDQEEELSNLKFPVPVPPDPKSLVVPPLEEAVKEEFYCKYLSPTECRDEGEVDSTAVEEQEEPTAPSSVNILSTVDGFEGLSSSELQAALDKIVSKTMKTFKSEVGKKISSSEKAHLGRLTQIEKTVH